MAYDPERARIYNKEYYERNKKLKGRRRGGGSSPRNRDLSSSPNTARTVRLKQKINKLNTALTAARAALAEKRRNARKSEKENSDGKTTAKERQSSKEYREKHQTEIANKRKSEASKSGGSSSGPKSLSSMSEDELLSRITKIQSALASAKKQLSSAASMAHGEFMAGIVGSDKYLIHSAHGRKESVKMTVADFGGYATRHGVKCSDGRTIQPDAFKDNDGMTVPLLYQHGHGDIDNVLGHCLLENRADGVYAHAYFNGTPAGQKAKEAVKHGDVKFLSIFANQLMEKTKNVIKGNIREVSLVVAGANPGAYIDVVNIAHSDHVDETGHYELFHDEAEITSGEAIDQFEHAVKEDEDVKTLEDVLATFDEDQRNALEFLVSQAMEHSGLDDSADEGEDASDDESNDSSDANDESADNADETDDSEGTDDAEGGAEGTDDEGSDDTEAGAEVQHDNINSQEDDSMSHNIFDQSGRTASGTRGKATLSHSAISEIVETAKDSPNGKLSKALQNYVREHGIEVDGVLQHGIENIEYLFPDAKTLESSPAFISRRMEWVDKVLGAVRKSPFSRIKTITADITPDEARARGYIKGNMKNEEFFALSKRETTPQTVYKKQKLDRDDVIDIVDLDVVAWLKAEMKVMLDEEIAGAILIGDGRSAGDEDKIKEINIRPIASDAELYVTTAFVNLDDANSTIEELVDSVITNRQYYKGSGTPTFYTTESVISKFLTVKDNFGRRLYNSVAEVASVLRVADVVPVEVMERVPDVVGIMVNLSDYTLGADRGGQATMFDDFDIDYNKLRYLIETRLSGALTTPKSAIVFRKVAGTATLVVPVEPTFDGTTVTVATTTGVTYKNEETNATLTTGAPVTLADGETLKVKAFPTSSSYYFANDQADQWSFTNEPA